MNTPLLSVLARLAWLGLFPASLAFAFGPGGDGPDLGNDKLGHMLGFLLLMLSTHLAFLPASRWHSAGWLLGYGLFIELIQGLLPYRSMELADLAADGLGIAIGALLLPLMFPNGAVSDAPARG